jgi:hypothetical protein
MNEKISLGKSAMIIAGERKDKFQKIKGEAGAS